MWTTALWGGRTPSCGPLVPRRGSYTDQWSIRPTNPRSPCAEFSSSGHVPSGHVARAARGLCRTARAGAGEPDRTGPLAASPGSWSSWGTLSRPYRSIRIAGTNGKTTTARILERILREAGLRTGRTTSPHLHSPVERIAIDGVPIDEEGFLQAYQDVEPFAAIVDAEQEAAGGVPLTYFEYLTAMAFQAFASAPVDVAVVETGLGGTWDATGVVDPDVTVITPISMDHMDYLGDTIAEIAGEKAGILTAEATAILASQPFEDAADVLRDRIIGARRGGRRRGPADRRARPHAGGGWSDAHAAGYRRPLRGGVPLAAR